MPKYSIYYPFVKIKYMLDIRENTSYDAIVFILSIIKLNFCCLIKC